MALNEPIELRAGSYVLRLESVEARWCKVSLRTPESEVILGADDTDIVVSRLLAALEQPAISVSQRTWVLSLSEAHASIYQRDVHKTRRLIVENAEGLVVADFDVPDSDRGNWIKRLDEVLRPIQDLRIDPADARALPDHPPHVVHELRLCATWTVSHPSAVFLGLRDEGSLAKGHMYCGLPPRAFDNACRNVDPPEGMVYCVSVTPDGYVFDWDWVQAGVRPGDPRDAAQRFSRREQVMPRARIVGVEGITASRSDLRQPFYSARGDCVFCYFAADLSYAQRAGDDLTIFRRRRDDVPTGFKIKNVQKLVRELMATQRRRTVDSGSGVQVTLLLERAGQSVAISDEAGRNWNLTVQKIRERAEHTFGHKRVFVSTHA